MYRNLFILLVGIVILGLAYFFYPKKEGFENILINPYITTNPNAMIRQSDLFDNQSSQPIPFDISGFSTIFGIKQTALPIICDWHNFSGYMDATKTTGLNFPKPPWKYTYSDYFGNTCNEMIDYEDIHMTLGFDNHVSGIGNLSHDWSIVFYFQAAENNNNQCGTTKWTCWESDDTGNGTESIQSYKTNFQKFVGAINAAKTNQAKKLLFGQVPWNLANTSNIISYSDFQTLWSINLGFTSFGDLHAYVASISDDATAFYDMGKFGGMRNYNPLQRWVNGEYLFSKNFTDAANEILRINMYGDSQLCKYHIDDFTKCTKWGSVFNFNDTNMMDMYLNVSFDDKYLNGSNVYYSFGLFLPDMAIVPNSYRYDVNSNVLQYNTYIRNLYNNDTNTYFIPNNLAISYDTNNTNIKIGSPVQPYNSETDGSQYPWSNAIDDVKNNVHTYYDSLKAHVKGKEVPNTDIENKISGMITPQIVSYLPNYSHRYITSWAYNRTQLVLTNVLQTYSNNIDKASYLMCLAANNYDFANANGDTSNMNNWSNYLNIYLYNYSYDTTTNTTYKITTSEDTESINDRTVRIIESGTHNNSYPNTFVANTINPEIDSVAHSIFLKDVAGYNFDKSGNVVQLYSTITTFSYNNTNSNLYRTTIDRTNQINSNSNLIYNPSTDPNPWDLTNTTLTDMTDGYMFLLNKLVPDYGVASNINIMDPRFLNYIAQQFYNITDGLYQILTIYDVFLIGSNMLDIRFDKQQLLPENQYITLRGEYQPALDYYNSLLYMVDQGTWGTTYSNINDLQTDISNAYGALQPIFNPVYTISNINPNYIQAEINGLISQNVTYSNAIQSNLGVTAQTSVTSSTQTFGGVNYTVLDTSVLTRNLTADQASAYQSIINSNINTIYSLSNQLNGIETNVARIFFTFDPNNLRGSNEIITYKDQTIQLSNGILLSNQTQLSNGTYSNVAIGTFFMNNIALGINAALSYNTTYSSSLQIDMGQSSGNVNFAPSILYNKNAIQPLTCTNIDFMKEATQMYMDGVFVGLSTFTKNIYNDSNGSVRVDKIFNFTQINENTCGFQWQESQYDYFTNEPVVRRIVNVQLPFAYDNTQYQNPQLLIDNTVPSIYLSKTLDQITTNPIYTFDTTFTNYLYDQISNYSKNLISVSNTIDTITHNYLSSNTFSITNSNMKTTGYLTNMQKAMLPIYTNLEPARVTAIKDGGDVLFIFTPGNEIYYTIGSYTTVNVGQLVNNTYRYNTTSTTFTVTSYFTVASSELDHIYTSVSVLADKYNVPIELFGANGYSNTIQTAITSNSVLLTPYTSMYILGSEDTNTYTDWLLLLEEQSSLKMTMSQITGLSIPKPNVTIAFDTEGNVVFSFHDYTTTSSYGYIIYYNDSPKNYITVIPTTDPPTYKYSLPDGTYRFTIYSINTNNNSLSFPTSLGSINISKNDTNNTYIYNTPFYLAQLNNTNIAVQLSNSINQITDTILYTIDEDSLTLSDYTNTTAWYLHDTRISAGSPSEENDPNDASTVAQNFTVHGTYNDIVTKIWSIYNSPLIMSNTYFINIYGASLVEAPFYNAVSLMYMISNINNIPFQSLFGTITFHELKAFDIESYNSNITLYNSYLTNINYLNKTLANIRVGNDISNGALLIDYTIPQSFLSSWDGACPNNVSCTDPAVMEQIIDSYNLSGLNSNVITRIMKGFTPNPYQCDYYLEFASSNGITTQGSMSFEVAADIDTCHYIILSNTPLNTGYFIQENILNETVVDSGTVGLGFQYIGNKLQNYMTTVSNVFNPYLLAASSSAEEMLKAFYKSRNSTYDALGKMNSITIFNTAPNCPNVLDNDLLTSLFQNNQRFSQTFFTQYPYLDSYMKNIVRFGVSSNTITIVYERDNYIVENNEYVYTTTDTAAAIYSINITPKYCDFSATFLQGALPLPPSNYRNMSNIPPYGYTSSDEYLYSSDDMNIRNTNYSYHILLNNKKYIYDTLTSLGWTNHTGYILIRILLLSTNHTKIGLYDPVTSSNVYTSPYIVTNIIQNSTPFIYSIIDTTTIINTDEFRTDDNHIELAILMDKFHIDLGICDSTTIPDGNYIDLIRQIHPNIISYRSNADICDYMIDTSDSLPLYKQFFRARFYNDDMFFQDCTNINIYSLTPIYNLEDSLFAYQPDATDTQLMNIFHTYYDSTKSIANNNAFNSVIGTIYTADISGNNNIIYSASVFYTDSNNAPIATLLPHAPYFENLQFFNVMFYDEPTTASITVLHMDEIEAVQGEGTSVNDMYATPIPSQAFYNKYLCMPKVDDTHLLNVVSNSIGNVLSNNLLNGLYSIDYMCSITYGKQNADIFSYNYIVNTNYRRYISYTNSNPYVNTQTDTITHNIYYNPVIIPETVTIDQAAEAYATNNVVSSSFSNIVLRLEFTVIPSAVGDIVHACTNNFTNIITPTTFVLTNTLIANQSYISTSNYLPISYSNIQSIHNYNKQNSTSFSKFTASQNIDSLCSFDSTDFLTNIQNNDFSYLLQNPSYSSLTSMGLAPQQNILYGKSDINDPLIFHYIIVLNGKTISYTTNKYYADISLQLYYYNDPNQSTPNHIFYSGNSSNFFCTTYNTSITVNSILDSSIIVGDYANNNLFKPIPTISPFENYVSKKKYSHVIFESVNYTIDSLQLFNKKKQSIGIKLIEQNRTQYIYEFEPSELVGYSFITNNTSSQYDPKEWILKGIYGKQMDILDKRRIDDVPRLHQMPLFFFDGTEEELDQPKSYKIFTEVSIDKSIFMKYYKEKIDKNSVPLFKKYRKEKDTYYIVYDEYDQNKTLVEQNNIIGFTVKDGKVIKAILYIDADGNYKPFNLENPKEKKFWDINIMVPLLFEEI